MLTPKDIIKHIRKEHNAVEILKKSLPNAEPLAAKRYRQQIEQHEKKIAELYGDLVLVDDTENQIYINAVNRIIN